MFKVETYQDWIEGRKDIEGTSLEEGDLLEEEEYESPFLHCDEYYQENLQELKSEAERKEEIREFNEIEFLKKHGKSSKQAELELEEYHRKIAEEFKKEKEYVFNNWKKIQKDLDEVMKDVNRVFYIIERIES